MIAAASEAHRLLAINFQQRHRPEVQAAYKLIQDGQLGVIQHVDMNVVWPRTAAYYNQAAWRGAWAGEGGGVLMNQAPHNLDLLCYLMGMPGKVIAWTRRLMHQIETEDTVQAMLEWPDGALGSLHVSTAEAGVAERLEIIGTRGCLLIGQGSLWFEQLETDMRQFVVESPEPFAAPALQSRPIPVEPGVGDHAAVYRNLHEAILYGAPLAADGYDGRMSLEVANAMIYSNYTGREVTLPLDRQQYLALLTDLKAQPGAWQWPAIDLDDK
jgi:predicted dehydrogenase